MADSEHKRRTSWYSLIVFGGLTSVFAVAGIGFYVAGSRNAPHGIGDDLRPQFTVSVEPQPTNVLVNAQLAICDPEACSPYMPDIYVLSVEIRSYFPPSLPLGSTATTKMVLGVPANNRPLHRFNKQECPSAETPVGTHQMVLVSFDFEKKSGVCSLATPLTNIVIPSTNGPVEESNIIFLFSSGLLVNQNAYYLHAVLPGFTTNAVAQSTFERTYQVPFSDNTSDYSLQVGKSPIRASEHYWQWEDPPASVSPDPLYDQSVDALPVTAVNLGGQGEASKFLLVAGLLFGFAGGALIPAVQALLDLSQTRGSRPKVTANIEKRRPTRMAMTTPSEMVNEILAVARRYWLW
jgi:hypothetical protein